MGFPRFRRQGPSSQAGAWTALSRTVKEPCSPSFYSLGNQGLHSILKRLRHGKGDQYGYADDDAHHEICTPLGSPTEIPISIEKTCKGRVTPLPAMRRSSTDRTDILSAVAQPWIILDPEQLTISVGNLSRDSTFLLGRAYPASGSGGHAVYSSYGISQSVRLCRN